MFSPMTKIAKLKKSESEFDTNIFEFSVKLERVNAAFPTDARLFGAAKCGA